MYLKINLLLFASATVFSLILGKGLSRRKTLFGGLSFGGPYGDLETPTQGPPTHLWEVSWPAFYFCHVLLSVCRLCCVLYTSAWCLVFGGIEKELTNSDFSPATLEDVPRVSGARYSRAHLSESVPRIGLFRAPPLSEGVRDPSGRQGIRTLIYVSI